MRPPDSVASTPQMFLISSSCGLSGSVKVGFLGPGPATGFDVLRWTPIVGGVHSMAKKVLKKTKVKRKRKKMMKEMMKVREKKRRMKKQEEGRQRREDCCEER